MLLINEQVQPKVDKALILSDLLVAQGAIKEEESLRKQLEYLTMWGNYDEPEGQILTRMHCIITPDFAPYSFNFALYTRCKPDYEKRYSLTTDWEYGRYMVEQYPELEGRALYMNGGLIFHGKHDNGGDGGAPTFSVNLTPTSGWSVHT
jgi:hypothetical protein